jgi:heme/copper-type cytochrome/quinol oxidase subunit 2
MARIGFVGKTLLGLGTLGLIAGAASWAVRGRGPGLEAVALAQDSPQTREFRITAHRYAYSVPRIEVEQNDLVKITLETSDIPHSFTVDAYRIAKRAAPGQPVVFEFQADKVGNFPFYCNLSADDGCRAMRGELVVRARK